MSRNTTIIVPVYGDWPSLKDCIESLIHNVQPPHKVMLVNDCGPEADVLEANILTSIKGHDYMEYHRNPRNLGFLQNCNRAVFELDTTGNDVMLLNSDTIVTEGLVDQLHETLYAEDKIATVSPRSNNATITTVPISSMAQRGLDNPKDSFSIFKNITNKLPKYNISPVSHGFCMLIKRSIIDEFGLFDEVFGKGYGEEVDFCMRVGKSGYKHAICNRAFVYHMEARSFTMETKQKLISENEKIVDKRYPDYRRAVRQYRLSAERQEAGILDSYIKRAASRTARLFKDKIKQQPTAHKVAKTLKSKFKVK